MEMKEQGRTGDGEEDVNDLAVAVEEQEQVHGVCVWCYCT
jgi:hypothetical protein